jgi:hypothetical protein
MTVNIGRRREMTIEWQMKYYHEHGFVCGKKIAHISDKGTSDKPWLLMFFQKEAGCYPDKDQAKAKAEQLFKEWKEAAGLISRSDITSCGKCGGSGVTKGCPKCGHDRITVFKGDLDYCLNCRETFPCGGSTKPCDCLKSSHSLASIERAVKEEGR